MVDRNPPFTKTVANFSTLDYLCLTTITGVFVTVGYLSMASISRVGRSDGGFMYAYQNSIGRLMGFFPNHEEVARYKK
ncbi:hypothetical protein Taro_043391 [Colocasia esculenta]|uniref:NADH-ubiquinone oxidoreductase 21kDa subunit N-terminal domain-containing protein n=1 Tax=Colocasia esculenta TaxID=4460 RepID=A0A843WRZ4_COLES|nr:hypothetical protein [Colocasia esculenta]